MIDHNALIEDIQQLATTLESSHPDPYTKGGGKIAFHRRLHRLMLSMPEEGMTKEAFQKRLLPFVAAVGDGHTRIHVNYMRDEQRPGGIPLLFTIIEKTLYVSGVVDEQQRHLIGSTLIAVEDVPFEELCERVTALRGTDNEYGALTLLEGKNYLWYASQLAELIPEWKQNDVTVQLKMPTGEVHTMTFQTPITIESPLLMPESAIEVPSTKACEFAYSFVDDHRKVALLRVDGMGGFRENFELVGLENQFQLDGARYFYRRYNERVAPEDKGELLQGIPSATETFTSLVIDMKRYGTKTLIIDLRRNVGGNSTLAHFLMYFLYGKDRLIEHFARTSGYEIIKYSPLYFDQVQDARKPTHNATFELRQHDYWFEDMYGLENSECTDAQKVTVELTELYAKIPTFCREYVAEQYSGYYTPENIMVLCSPLTYSSGYTMMKNLHLTGGTLIGTPSAQAENAPGWILNFTLKNSGLTGWVACKWYASCSDRIHNGVYQLDHELTYDQLKAYRFDPNSEVLLALSLLENETRQS